MVNVNCDLCGSASHSLKYEIDINEKNLRFYRYTRNVPDKEKFAGKHKIVTCNDCGLVFTNPRFTTDELEVVYSSEKIIGGNWKYYKYLFDTTQPDEIRAVKKQAVYDPSFYQWKFDIIEKYCKKAPKDIKLLDVGCGDGRFVFDAFHRGYDITGIDLSPDRVEQGIKHYNLSENMLRCMNIDEFSSNEKFDVIVMFDLIEHVESPATVLQNLKKITHEDSIVLMLTMSMDSITYKLFKKNWYYINPSQHLHYFSHKTMAKMLEKNDFELLGVEMDDSKTKNFIHFIYRIMIGFINQFFFYIYTKKSILRFLFRGFQKDISDERMMNRLENLYPGKYVGRYHDNFVFVAKQSKK
jgi:2-polyprenyl-3-methyl-5-hydroxy-6-metoxy-1,4-benzoquinol methylase